MKTLTFKNGDQMPIVGLGTWKSQPGDVYNAVKVAVQQGYRHIDCAYIYGNEKEVGQALTESFSEGIVNRDEMWITSKLWNDSHAPEDVQPALEATLSNLQLDYLDLYLIHWPVVVKKGVGLPQSADEQIALEDLPISTTWSAMETLVEKGLSHHIGVSNFSIKKIENLLSKATRPPELNQIELHPYLQQKDMLDFCRDHGVHLTAYSPLGSMDRPEGLKEADEPILLEDPTIVAIANQHDATPAQILISWAIHRGTAVIPKSVTPSRIEQNLAAANVSLTEDDMQKIADLDRHRRYLNGSMWALPGGHYTLENLWDE